MAEWSKALDLGSSHFDGVGSNPTAATFPNVLFSPFLHAFGSVLSFSCFLKLILKKHKEGKKRNERNWYLSLALYTNVS